MTSEAFVTSGQLVGWLTALYFAGFLIPFFDRDADTGKTLPPLSWPIRASLLLSLLGSTLAFVVSFCVAFEWWSALPPNSIVALVPWFKDSSIPAIFFAAQVDRLGAFFALIISGFSVLVAIYSFGALTAGYFSGHRRGIASAFNVFVWSTLLVVLVADCISLLIALEFMTWSFGYLALYKHYKEDNQKKPERDDPYDHKVHNAFLAPQVYMMVSHTSTAFLIVAITILGLHAGSLDYQGIIDAVNPPPDIMGGKKLEPLGEVTASAVFLLSLAGLGIRVGLVPAHIWVSLVHPSSPTPTHALSLGIAIKVGIYLMIRFFFQFTEPYYWWGYILLLVASVTALVNVWYAIASHDLKTALAYHSIENIGIMTAGLGVALIFVTDKTTPSAQWLAALALVACLYHLLNHAIFKGLLYMATGAVDFLKKGKGVEYSRLGGLARLYPWTSAAFIAGAFAISGFPPLNGFVSEWLTLQTLLVGIESSSPLTIAVLIAALIMLAVAFALTAFCFYKIVSVAFLGDPRLEADRRKLEAKPRLQRMLARKRTQRPDRNLAMLGVMGIMGALCLFLGIMPGLVVRWLAAIVNDIPRFDNKPRFAELSIDHSSGWGSLSLGDLQLPIIWLALGAVCLGAIGWMIANLSIRDLEAAKLKLKPVKRVKDAWNCGTPFQPATQYTDAAASMLVRGIAETSPPPTPLKELPIAGSKPVWMVSDEEERSKRIVLDDWIRMSRNKDHPQFVREVFRSFYNLVSRWIYTSSDSFGRWIQNGDIRRYLRYILLSQLAILIVFLIFSPKQ